MKKFLSFIPFVLLLSLVFISCEKEYSFENGGIPTGGGPNPATFSFSGSPGNCSGAIVSGTYKAGIATGAANTVSVNALVDSAGTYNVTVGPVNGVTFTGAGSFSGTGLQTVVLTASGTPTTAGDFNFTAGGAGGCTFTITVAPNTGSSGGTAVYNFDGEPGNCTGAIVNGTYTAGTITNTGNTVQLTVNVTTAGTYNISTTSNNGITFSGAGTFTAAGNGQTVILTASGTPTAQGDYNFTAGTGGCVFSVTVNPAVTAGTYFYNVTVDGTNYTNTANVGDYGYYIGNDGFDSVDCHSGVVPMTDPVPAGETSIIIGKGTFYDWFTATDAQFKSFFSPGAYPYAPVGWKNGISIEWGDGTGKYWSTDNAPGTQTGSTFTITAVEDDAVEFPFYSVRVTATFNCIVYDEMGNSKTITNGTYRGVFSKQ